MNWLRFTLSPLRGLAWILVKAWVRRSFSAVPTISTTQLAQNMRESSPAFLLIDTRSAEEYAVSHLPTAVRAQTVEAVEAAMLQPKTTPTPALPPYFAISSSPITPLSLYCSIGYRSARLGAALQQKGHTRSKPRRLYLPMGKRRTTARFSPNSPPRKFITYSCTLGPVTRRPEPSLLSAYHSGKSSGRSMSGSGIEQGD